MGQPPTCTPNIIYISAGKCRGPKSWNRIELSWFIQVLLHIYWFEPSWLLWVGVGVGVSRSASPTCPYIHAHAHMCMHMHNTKIYMYSNCKWLPPWKHPCLLCLSCLTCMCSVCAFMHACTCVLVDLDIDLDICFDDIILYGSRSRWLAYFVMDN